MPKRKRTKISVKSSVQALIKRECANHDNSFNDITNYCWKSTDKQCPYFNNPTDNSTNSTFRCGYFEECVLPLEPETEALYNLELEATQLGYIPTKQEKQQAMKQAKQTVTIVCDLCGNEFEGNSLRQKYCLSCSKIVKRNANKKSNLKKQTK